MFFFSLFSFLLGLSVGSFLNCLIYRLLLRKNILGRSFCPKCQHQLSWLDLIPVFSFLFLGGRCRYCQQKISWQYPLVELTTGLLFLFAFLRLSQEFTVYSLQFTVFLLRNWLFIIVLIFIFVYDLKYMLIEDMVVIPATVVIFFLNLLIFRSLSLILLGGIIGLGFFLVQYILTAKKGVGEGDLRLGLLMGLAFGWSKILIALFVSYLIGGSVALILLLTGQKKLTSKIPLGPFLALGSLITLFFSQEILSFYQL